MSGVKNNVLFGGNVDFSNNAPNYLGSATLVSNGQMLIASTALNAGGTHINVGTLTSPNGSITIGYSSPNITLQTASGGTDLHTAQYIVSPGGSAAGANYTTIASAYAAAVAAGAPQTVFVQDGTYTENITLTPGINIASFTSGGLTPNVIVKGKFTFTATGTVTLTGISLQTNSDFALSVSGSNACTVYLNNCYLNVLNNNLIQFTNSNSASIINVISCQGNIGTTGIALHTHSSTGSLIYQYCQILNTGGTSTAASNSAGNVQMYECVMYCPFASSSTGFISSFGTRILCASVNATGFAQTGTGFTNLIDTFISSGSASAISVGSGATVKAVQVGLDSTNTNAVTGAGALQYTPLAFNNTGIGNNVTGTLTHFPQGQLVLISSQTASNSASLIFTGLTSYMTYFVTITGCGPVTNTQKLELLVSQDNGSTYLSTGYLNGINYSVYNSATITNTNATTFIPICNTMTNSNNLSAQFYLFNVDTGAPIQLFGFSSWNDTTAGTFVSGSFLGQGPSGVTAIKFQYGSGNINAAVITLYGVATT